MALLLLAGVRVITGLLPPEEFGLFALLTAFQAFAGLVLINPTNQYLNRHTHEWLDQGRLVANVRALERYWAGASVGVGLVVAIWLYLHALDDLLLTAIVGGGAVGFLIFAATSLIAAAGRLNMIGLRASSVAWQVIGAALSLAASVLLTVWKPNAVSWVMGQALGSSCALLGARAALRQSAGSSSRYADVKLRDVLPRTAIEKFCIPLGLMAVFMWLDTNAYRFILESAWGLGRFGVFVVALILPSQMTTVVETIVQQYVYPYAYRGLTNASTDEAQQVVVSDLVSLLTPLYLAWGAFLVLSSGGFLQFLTDPRYHGASRFLAIGIAVEVVRLLSAPWMFIAQARKDFFSVIYPFVFSAGIVLLGAVISLIGKGVETFFGVSLVVAAIGKAVLLIYRMGRQMPVKVAIRPTVSAAMLLVIALLIQSTIFADRGDPLSALTAIVLSTIGIGLFVFVYIRKCDSFWRLTQHRLSHST